MGRRCFAWGRFLERLNSCSLMFCFVATSRLLELRLLLFDSPVCPDAFDFLSPSITCLPDLELKPVSPEGRVTLPDVPATRPVCVRPGELIDALEVEDLVEVSEETDIPFNELSDLILVIEVRPCKPREGGVTLYAMY